MKHFLWMAGAAQFITTIHRQTSPQSHRFKKCFNLKTKWPGRHWAHAIMFMVCWCLCWVHMGRCAKQVGPLSLSLSLLNSCHFKSASYEFLFSRYLWLVSADSLLKNRCRHNEGGQKWCLFPSIEVNKVGMQLTQSGPQ